jgi:hypothetical protein
VTARVRKRVRTLGSAVALLALVAALLWVSDALSRVGAQSLIARAAQQQVPTSQRPQVHLHGAFFLPQVVHGVYDDVEIDIAPLTTDQLRIASLHTELHGVHLSFHDVLTRNTGHIVVDRTSELATLRFADINRYLATMGTPVAVSAAGQGQVRITGTVQVLGQRVSAAADAIVRGRGSTLLMTPTRLATGIAGLDDASQLLLGQRFTVQIPLQSLPFGQSLGKITVQQTGVSVHASGTHVPLVPPGG